MFYFQRFKRQASGMALVLGGALLVSGCGGGSTGPSTPSGTPTPTSSPSTLMADEFNGNSLDSNRWGVLGTDSQIQRTRFGNAPAFSQDSDGTHFVRLNLNTFLPDDAVRQAGTIQVQGTEFGTKSRFARGNGLSFETRMRLTSARQLGLVNAFFLYSDKGNFGGTPLFSLDEIDHEVLSNQLFTGSPYSWTNIYNDFRLPQRGLESGDSYVDNPTRTEGESESLVSSFNPDGWNTYRIEWKPGSVQWFINDTLIRTDTSVRVPDDALGVRFNIWAASAAPYGWDAAFNDALKPAATSGENQTFSLDVDWVRVKTLDGNAPVTSALVRIPPATSTVPMAGYRSK